MEGWARAGVGPGVRVDDEAAATLTTVEGLALALLAAEAVLCAAGCCRLAEQQAQALDDWEADLPGARKRHQSCGQALWETYGRFLGARESWSHEFALLRGATPEEGYAMFERLVTEDVRRREWLE